MIKNIISQQQKRYTYTPTIGVLPTITNQPEEIRYFNAYYLPIEEKNNIQIALNEHGSVRLGQGDYSGVDIVIDSNMSLYGHPSLTMVSNITIKAGSSDVLLEDLFPADKLVTFESGSEIKNCTFKTIKWAIFKGDNVKIKDNSFINIISRIQFDCSQSGYMINNKFIKHQVHGHSYHLIMKGNDQTPSYGNVHIHNNFLTPSGDATDIDNLKTSTFVGLDSEGWNGDGIDVRPMLDMKNMGKVKVTDFGGGNGYSPENENPVFNIEAEKLLFINKLISAVEGSGDSTIGPDTDVLYYSGTHDNYQRLAGTPTGYDLRGHYSGYGAKNDVTIDTIVQTQAITRTDIIADIIGTQHTPFDKPLWITLPNPGGDNWGTTRGSQEDSTMYIQNLINTNGIAELSEGNFYISSTLYIEVNGLQGILGSGTGKTVLIGKTDDFPLITLVESATGDNNFILRHLTLQGGSKGVYAPDEIDQMALVNLKYVVFRNQKYGIHLYRIFGLDNCFFDNVSFVDCEVGFFQDPDPVYSFANAGYVDKVVFYGGQYINCDTAVSMRATRANNLNTWLNCRFNRNKMALSLAGNNFAMAANCVFSNGQSREASGVVADYDYIENAVVNGDASYYNCDFTNNPNAFVFNSKNTFLEGCNLLGNSGSVFSNNEHYEDSHFIINSTVNGNLGGAWGKRNGMLVNSIVTSNPELSKLLINLKENVFTVLIDQPSNPYPQLLVTQ